MVVLRLVILYYGIKLLEAFNHVLVLVETQSQSQLQIDAVIILEEVTATSLRFLYLILFNELIVRVVRVAIAILRHH